MPDTLSPTTSDAVTPMPWRLPLVRTVLTLEVLVVLALAAGLAASYRQTLSAETDVLQVMARAVAARVDGTLQATEATLQATLVEVSERRIEVRGEGLTALLRERAELLPMFDTLAVVDEEGTVLNIASDNADRLPVRSIRLAPDLATAGRFELGRAAVQSDGPPSASGRELLAAALPWPAPAGQGTGHLVALAEPRFFDERLFQQITSGHSPVLGLWTDDGVSLTAGEPKAEDRQVGRLLRAVAVRRQSSGGLPPPLPQETLPDVVAVLQPLGAYPLVVSVSRGRDPVLAGWRTQAQAIGGLTVLALAGVLAFAVRSARVAERLQAAQAESRASAARLAERMQTAHRMEALGTLAGGIAHDFNNVLAAVIGYGEMARDTAVPGSAQARQLDQILLAGARGQGLIERILAFSRRRGAGDEVRRFEAQPVVAEGIALLRGSLRPEMRLVADLNAQGEEIDGDPTLLFEAVMNLCTNALHAMPRGGEVTIRLRRVADPGSTAHLELQVRDTGVGIAPDILPRIFEPFFSRPVDAAAGLASRDSAPASPDQHVGTGLGLAVVQGAVLALGGSIQVESRLGEGSTFTLRLPLTRGGGQTDAADAPSAASDPRTPSPAAPPSLATGQGQTVMWVDDEPGLVAYGEELLAGLGYEPVGFSCPEAALAALRREPARFDAIITDQVMPGLTGMDLAAAAQRLRPGLPVLMVSGAIESAAEDPSAGGPAARLAARLPKPIDRQRLAQSLSHALVAAPSP